MPTSRQLRLYLAVQRDVDRVIAADLERAARDAQRQLEFLGRQIQGPGARTRQAQIRRTLTQLGQAQRALWRGQGDDAYTGILPAILAGRERMVTEAQDLDDELRHVLYSRIPDRADAEAVEAGLNETARNGMRQYLARRPVTLSRAVYRNEALARGQVERRIRSALARGLAPREFAAEVRAYISPTVRGGVAYAAMRLARTEIARANRERQIENARRPGVTHVEWRMSDSHDEKDICDTLAGKRWPADADDIPQIGHPMCRCQLVSVLASPAAVARAFDRGEFDDEISRRLAARRAARG